MTAFRFKPWHDFAAFLLLAALLIVGVCCCSGCLGMRGGMTPEEAAKAGGVIGAVFGPWGSLIGAGVAYATALAARKVERSRMIAAHAETVGQLTRTITAMRETQPIPAAKYSPTDEQPNGSGLDAHS